MARNADCDRAQRSLKLHAMASARVELRYRNRAGARALNLSLNGERVEEGGVAVSVRVERREERSIVRAIVSNRGGEPLLWTRCASTSQLDFPPMRPRDFSNMATSVKWLASRRGRHLHASA